MMIEFGSLFSSVGGLDLGLERAGLRCKWQVEYDPWRRGILEQHWPGLRRHDDARTFPPSDVASWRVDLIAGGDPCQENSNARRTSDALQSSLGGEFIRILDAIRPRMFLRENPSAVRSDAPWPWWRFRSATESLGYAVLPFRLRACCVGADHRRDRLFLLGELQDANQARLEGHVGQEVARTGTRGQHTDIARPTGGGPSPRFVEALMGFPEGWTIAIESKPSETPLTCELQNGSAV